MPILDGAPLAAAQRGADLLAVLDPGAGVPEPNAVVEVLRRYGEPEPIELTTADVDGLRRVAEDLIGVFTAPDTAHAATLLNRLLRVYGGAPRLTAHDDTPWHLHVDAADDGPWAAWYAASSAMALATLLAERQTNPAGICGSERCGRPFIDTGRGGPRRYCSARCATRERVAAHRRAAGN